MASRQSTLHDVIGLLGNARWDAKALCSLIQASKSTGQLVLHMGTEHPALLDVRFNHFSTQPPNGFMAWAAQYGVFVKSLSLQQGYSRRRFDFLAVSLLIAEASAVASTLAGHESKEAKAAVQHSVDAVQNIRNAIKEQERNNKDIATEYLDEAQRYALQSLQQSPQQQKKYVTLQSLEAGLVSEKYFSVHNPMARVTRLCVQIDDADALLLASHILPLLPSLRHLQVGSNGGGLYHETALWAPVIQQINNVSRLELNGLTCAKLLHHLPAASLESLRVHYYPDERVALHMTHLTKLTSLDIHVDRKFRRVAPNVLPSSLQHLEYTSSSYDVASVMGGLTNLRSLKLWGDSFATDGRPLADLVVSQTALPALAAVTLICLGGQRNIGRLVEALGPRLKTLCTRDSWSLELCQALSAATCLTQLDLCVQGVAHNPVYEAFKAALPRLTGLQGFYLGSNGNLRSHSRTWRHGNEILEIATGLLAVAPQPVAYNPCDCTFRGVKFSEQFLVHDDAEPISGGCVAFCIPETW